MADVSVEDLTRFCGGIPVGIFEGLEAPQLQALSDIASRQSFDVDEVIIADGESGDTMYLLLSGKVRVSKKLYFRQGRSMVQGDREVIELPAEWNPYFGELALFDANALRTAAVTGSEAGELAVFRNADFFSLAEGDHDTGYIVCKNVLTKAVSTISKGNENVINLTTALSFALSAKA